MSNSVSEDFSFLGEESVPPAPTNTRKPLVKIVRKLIGYFQPESETEQTLPVQPLAAATRPEAVAVYRELAGWIRTLLTSQASHPVAAQKKRIEAVKLLVIPFGIVLTGNLYVLQHESGDLMHNLLMCRLLDTRFLLNEHFRRKKATLRQLCEEYPHQINDQQVKLLWESLAIVAGKTYEPALLKLFLLKVNELIASFHAFGHIYAGDGARKKPVAKPSTPDNTPTDASTDESTLIIPYPQEDIVLALLDELNPEGHRFEDIYELLILVNKHVFLRIFPAWKAAPPAQQQLAEEIFYAASIALERGEQAIAQRLILTGERVLLESPQHELKRRLRRNLFEW